MADALVFPGRVEWSGENPGIPLKEGPDGPFTALASLFRVVLSPHGRGHALVLLRSPQEASPPADRSNLCLTDNERLARWLIAEFVSYFGTYGNLPGLGSLAWRTLDEARSVGDPLSNYSEVVRAGDLTVELAWRGSASRSASPSRPRGRPRGVTTCRACSSAARARPSR